MREKKADQRPEPGGLVRLNKVLASSGVCSRRKADALIAQGLVEVNGHVVTALGTKIDPGQDRVTVEGRPLAPGQQEPPEPVYLALNKPVHTITSLSDPQGRPTVLDLLPKELKARRILPVGRLDAMSEGLLLLTDHGELIHRLTHAHWQVPKTYRVLVRGQVPPGVIEAFQGGMTLREGDTLTPVRVDRVEPQGRQTWLEMTLYQGRNRQIRRMCRDSDLTVLRLIRIRQGPIELGHLPSGQCRALTKAEVRSLLEQTDLVG